MRRYLVVFYAVLLMAASFVPDVKAQAATAKTHVEAARGAIAPKVPNPKAQYHVFKALFDQMCAEPQLPDQMQVQDRSAVVPRKEWFAVAEQYLRPAIIHRHQNDRSVGGQHTRWDHCH